MLNEFLIITAILMPGILLMTLSEKKLYQDIDMETPSFGLRLLKHIILAFPFALLGIFFYKRTGFEVFSLEGIGGLSILVSLGCALLHVAIYYLYFKKNVTDEVFLKVEASRHQIGILTRTLYGGIVEEVVFRFGLMSFFVWLFDLFLSNFTLSIWIANILASILFALAHLPSIYQMKVPVTKHMLIYSNSMNIMVGLCCGWLYWKEGLSATILCHMLFHLVWFIFEKIEHSTKGKFSTSVEK